MVGCCKGLFRFISSSIYDSAVFACDGDSDCGTYSVAVVIDVSVFSVILLYVIFLCQIFHVPLVLEASLSSSF